jgi:hypothetical protein
MTESIYSLKPPSPTRTERSPASGKAARQPDAAAGTSNASERRTEANRRNAKKSTGPRTAAGKAASARNALKHGLRAESLIVTDERLEDFDQFRLEMLEDLGPVGALECFLANRIAELSWRLRRPARAEATVFRHNFSGVMQYGEPFGWHFRVEGIFDPAARIQRYETSLVRNLDRALDQFQVARANRLSEEATAAGAD